MAETEAEVQSPVLHQGAGTIAGKVEGLKQECESLLHELGDIHKEGDSLSQQLVNPETVNRWRNLGEADHADETVPELLEKQKDIEGRLANKQRQLLELQLTYDEISGLVEGLEERLANNKKESVAKTSTKQMNMRAKGATANKNQFLKAALEAESYRGPSIIIAYAPCINHGINMGLSQEEEKKAVETGYWTLYKYNPALKEEGKNPLILDSKEPKGNFREFLLGEVRYSSLTRTFPDDAEALFQKAEEDMKERYEAYKLMAS